ncbi:MAG: enoyl-CoA hydratase/isomerase family protein [Alphaproteobacteria bacterium]|nr:enoyl-CoA hydratase/isomerase family protein [Alphaproteobacteria bacterium]
MPDVVRYALKGRVGIITVDNPPVNALGHAVRLGLVQALDRALADPACAAIVLMAAGRTFMAGADVREFGRPPVPPTNPEVIERYDQSKKPIVAAIHGTALGGGLEQALGCQYRAAVPSARLGTPEIKLGLIPGAGGTQRLPRLVGVPVALDMVLSGEPLGAAKAKEVGLIDAVIEGDLETGAVAFAESIADKRPLPRISDRSDKLAAVRKDRSIFAQKRGELARSARNLVAPFRGVDAVEMALDTPLEEGLERERQMFLDLTATPQSKAARHLFFAERECARIPDIPGDTPTRDIKTAAVLGAGTMGSGIAICFANAGIPVTVIEANEAALERGLAGIRKTYASQVERGRLSPAARDERVAKISGRLEYEALREADVVVEAVFEDMDIKKKVYAELDRLARPGAVLATNTSTLDINEIAAATGRPQDVVGMHFFSPANVMRLLEVIRGKATAPDTMMTAMKLGRTLGKIAVPMGVCFGFVGNRMMMRAEIEAHYMLEEGAMPQDIDRVLREFGLPLGLFGMLDLAGVDVMWRVRQHQKKVNMPGMPRLSTILDRIAEKGRYGQKSGAGYYRYAGRNAMPDPWIEDMIAEESRKLGLTRRVMDDDEIHDRFLFALIDEGARILDERIALRPSDVDVVYVNGFGFPAWRGGPMHYADQLGLETILATIRRFEQRFGSRWTPSPLLARLAGEEKGFASLQAK